MVYMTGDTHADIDVHKLSRRHPSAKQDGVQGPPMEKGDFLIICGDFGFIFDAGPYNIAAGRNDIRGSVYSDPYETKFETWWLNWLSEKPWTTLFVDGNHENHERLAAMPVYEWHGGKVHMLRKNIIHLMRGQVFEIEGSTFFTFGGASSHDKEFRREHISWWSGEIPSDEEFDEGTRNLAAHGNTVDYIVTHCLPDNVQDALFPYTQHDRMTNYLEQCVRKETKFRHWYCGHYHSEIDAGPFHVLYNRIIEAGK